jgi:hypothetical protein
MIKKNYFDIVESWVWLFIDTMESGYLRLGNASGIAPKGIKIIFDGYGEKEDGSENINILTFAIFVHKDSLKKNFPPHETNSLTIIHRPKEEICFSAFYDLDTDSITVNEPENIKLDEKFFSKLIFDIDKREQPKYDKYFKFILAQN